MGAEVGYSVRFDERTSARTRILYLTGKPTSYAALIFPCVTVHAKHCPRLYTAKQKLYLWTLPT